MNNKNEVKSFICQAAILMGHKLSCFTATNSSLRYKSLIQAQEKTPNSCHLMCLVKCYVSLHSTTFQMEGVETEQTNLKAVFVLKQHCRQLELLFINNNDMNKHSRSTAHLRTCSEPTAQAASSQTSSIYFGISLNFCQANQGKLLFMSELSLVFNLASFSPPER